MKENAVKKKSYAFALRMQNNNFQFSILNFQLILLFLPCMAFAQYNDHRNRHVDSLEFVLATSPPAGEELGKIYYNLMWGYQENNPAKSSEYARRCISVCMPLDLWTLVADGYKVTGMNFCEISQYDSALVYFDKALAAAGRIRGKDAEIYTDEAFATVYGNIGSVYGHQGKHYEAIEYYTKAIQIFEKHEWKEGIAILYGNIGYIYLTMHNYRQSEMNLIKSDSLAHQIGDSLLIANIKKQLGALYLYQQDYAQALQNAGIACGYFISRPEEGIDKATTYTLLAEIYLDGYDNDRAAEEYVRQNLQLLDTLDIPREKAMTLCVLSKIYLKRGEWRNAVKTAFEALATDDSEPLYTLALYEVLSKAYGRLGDIDKSSEYFDKYKTLKTSWSNNNYQSAIREMEVKYETEKKEMEIERQHQVIARANMQREVLAAGVAVFAIIVIMLWYMLHLRTRRNRELAEMNATKDKFFSIISHDLKNPAITQRDALRSLVDNGRIWDVDTLSDYYSELLNSAEGEVELVYNLLDWARIQTGRITYAPKPFNLSTRMRADISLARAMSEKKGISFLVAIPDHVQITGDGNMLSTVVRNLLTNAVKFTAAGGTVSLVIESTVAGKYTVSVSDTGTGMTGERIQSLFRLENSYFSEGTSGEQGSGLGLVVCKELLEKHGTTLRIESEEGKGSVFRFELKAES